MDGRQSDVDFQISKERKLFLITQIFSPLFHFHRANWSKSRKKHFNIKFIVIIVLHPRADVRFKLWGHLRRRNVGHKCFAAKQNVKKAFSDKSVGFSSSRKKFFTAAAAFQKPIMKIKQKTCLFSSNINRNFFQMNTFYIKHKNPSSLEVFFCNHFSYYFNFVPYLANKRHKIWRKSLINFCPSASQIY